MSLKAFHIVFIIFSTLLALGTGVWCLWINFVAGAPIYVAGATASFVVAIVLMVYGVWFYRKMKRLRIFTCYYGCEISRCQRCVSGQFLLTAPYPLFSLPIKTGSHLGQGSWPVKFGSRILFTQRAQGLAL